MRTPRIAVVGVVAVVVLLAASYTASAQPRTNPPTLDFTCYGYDNGPQRAYNCIPERSQQSLMRTFVPAVGSRCDDGKIITTSDQPDRIVFQIRCQDGGGTTPPPTSGWRRTGSGPDYFSKPINVERVRITSKYSGRGENFIVWCRAPEQSLIVNEIIGSAYGNDGTTGVYRMHRCSEVEVRHSMGVSWEFRQEGALTAFTPTRTWADVTGVGMGLSAEALALLATAVEIERAVVVRPR